jgi:hypothetical protein
MKNKNLILFLAAGAAYWYFFMYKKKEALKIEQPGFTDQPGTSAPVAMLQPAIQTESVSITEQIKEFSAPARVLPYKEDNAYQNYYVQQISGVKKMGVPFTI